MKNKKLCFLGIALVSCLSFAVACTNNNSNNSGSNSNNSTGGVNTSDEITLNGFDIPEEVNYYYGSNIQITLPLVIDSIGNVMDVYYTVKNNAGETVSLEYGRFFAMDEAGYDVEYVVITADGKTHKKQQEINVLKKHEVENAILVDVGTETTFDILTALPEEHRQTVNTLKTIAAAKMELLPCYSEVAIPLTSTELDLAKMEKCCYKFAVQAPIGLDMEYADIYSCEIDFYNSNDGMVWVDNSNLNIKNAHAKLEGMTEEIATENLPQGAVASQYFYITDNENDGAGNFLMAISAIHSKEYYEMWKKDGATFLQYDVYLKDTNIGEKGYFCVDKTLMENFIWISVGQWTTIEIPIDILLDYYDDYGNDGAQSFNFGNMLQSGEYSYQVQMYIGNFRGKLIDKTLDAEMNLADLKGNFDFIDILLENGKSDIANELTAYEANGDIVWTVDGEVVSDIFALRGVYDVVATYNGKKVYTGKVDFYNSDDGMVWVDNSNLNIENAHAKLEGMTEEIATENLPQGAVASQYFYITDNENDGAGNFLMAISAIHSKEYYEMWKEKGVTALQYDVYLKDTNIDEKGYFCVDKTMMENFIWVPVGQWKTIEIPIDILLDYYDDYGNDEAQSFNFGNMLQSGEYSYQVQMYIGNFREKKAE